MPRQGLADRPLSATRFETKRYEKGKRKMETKFDVANIVYGESPVTEAVSLYLLKERLLKAKRLLQETPYAPPKSVIRGHVGKIVKDGKK